MLLNWENKENYTIPLEVSGVFVSRGELLELKLKGLDDMDVCAEVLEADLSFTGGISSDLSTKEQVAIIRNATADVLIKYVSAWNIDGFDFNKKNLKKILKEQTALWDIRKAFYDFVSEAATGKTRTQKEEDQGNLLKLAVRGSLKVD